MITNLNQVEYIFRELKRDRMQEATQWRVVHQCIINNPSPYHQLSNNQGHARRHSDLEPRSQMENHHQISKKGKVSAIIDE